MRKIILLLLLLASSPAVAGGPFFVDPNGGGYPMLWQNNELYWAADSGRLSPKISNEKALRWVRELFDIWKGASLENADGAVVPVADFEFNFVGLTKQDINIDNFDMLAPVGAYNGGPLALIVFDETGEIIEDQFGDGQREYTLGFATPLSNMGHYFVGGMVVLNGFLADKLTEGALKAAMLHEIGHILNLDHTQANIEAAARFEEGDQSLAGEIPTMYPFLFSVSQLELNADDKIALAEQYPTAEYLDNFCKITGELAGPDGSGVQGADVVARAKDDNEWSDVRTFVSGVLYPPNTKNGDYALGGLVPGREYIVSYRGINPEFNAGSGLAPYDPPREDIGNGVIAESVIACGSNGEQPLFSVGVTETTAVAVGAAAAEENTGAESSTAAPAGCSLIIR